VLYRLGYLQACFYLLPGLFVPFKNA
jgi:hypothetical protein